MKVALVQCPANNPDSPPYAYALLNACLKSAGHEPYVFDLNIALYQEAKKRGIPDPWRSGHSQESPIEYWINEPYVRETLAPYRDFLRAYVDEILASGAPVIGFSAHTSSYLASMRIAEQVKAVDPTRTIVFGGPTASSTTTATGSSSGTASSTSSRSSRPSAASPSSWVAWSAARTTPPCPATASGSPTAPS